MTIVFYIVALVILFSGVTMLLERKHRRRLSDREPVDWDEIASTHFAEPAGRVAVTVVVDSIAEAMGIHRNQVYPDDDINEDYRIPGFWGTLRIDDPGHGIIATIEERIEEHHTSWILGACGSEVRDIIESLRAHLQGEVPTFHGQCSCCGYNLRGLTELRCPECGTPFGTGPLSEND